jgi:hypothetical protein
MEQGQYCWDLLLMMASQKPPVEPLHPALATTLGKSYLAIEMRIR